MRILTNTFTNSIRKLIGSKKVALYLSFKYLTKRPGASFINTLRPRQNGRRFAEDTFKRIFLNENVTISIKISLKFVPKGPINNNPRLASMS